MFLFCRDVLWYSRFNVDFHVLDFSLVPRTPNTRFAEEQQRTPVSTPLSRQRSTPDYGAFLIDHFRTPTVNGKCAFKQFLLAIQPNVNTCSLGFSLFLVSI